MKHLAIVGHSAEGAALCFTTFCHAGSQRLGPDLHPDVTLDCISFAQCMPAYDRGDYDAVREVLAISLRRLAQAGADFFVCPDNTAHLALERPGPDLPLPGLHIAEVLAEEAARRGYTRVGVLGTRFTMDGPMYPRSLARHGIDAVVPVPADRRIVDEVIFGELVRGAFTDSSRQEYVRIIEWLAAQQCDAVALACTEIPLLISPQRSPLPTLDSTRLLAHAALGVAIEEDGPPRWRGGPL